MKIISSRDNPLFKRLHRLSTSSRERRKSGKALLDGMHLIKAYCDSCSSPDMIVLSSGARAHPEISEFLDSRPELEPVVFAPGLFNDIAQVTHPVGIIAICDVPRAGRPKAPPKTCVLLEGIQDPGNLGSILRSAAAAGVKDVFLSSECAFAWSPKTLRAGMGAHFLLTIHEGAELADTARWFDGAIIATLPRARQSLFATDLTGRLAWLFGTEGEGLSPTMAALATTSVAIPMARRSESLNVAAAAAICFFEQVRQSRS